MDLNILLRAMNLLEMVLAVMNGYRKGGLSIDSEEILSFHRKSFRIVYHIARVLLILL